MRTPMPSPGNCVRIAAADRYIHPQLEALKAIDPCATEIDGISVDQRPLAPGEPVPNILGNGAEEVYLVEPGFSLHFAESVIAHHWKLETRSAENCLRLRIPFAGEAQHGSPQVRIADLGSQATFMIQPAGTSVTGIYRAGANYRFCSLHMSESFLIERLGIPPNSWPRLLTTSWQGRDIAFGRIELGKAPLATAGRLFHMSSHGPWRIVEVRAIALDLLRLLFDAWAEDKGAAAARIRLRPRERDQLLTLRMLADTRCPDPVSLDEALALTGLNRNKLHVGFKRLFGLSLHDYCLDLRMQRAKRLLLDSDLAIARIAEATGFSEPTNFTAAFRKHFAVLPSEVRAPQARYSTNVS